MQKITTCVTYGLSGLALALTCAELIIAGSMPVRSQTAGRRTELLTVNATGIAKSLFINGQFYDLTNPFFASIGTNGRSCASCHVPSDGWTISPAHLQARFNATAGLDPVFDAVDGADNPNADRSTVDARRAASSLLLNRGLIRVAQPIPARADFRLVSVTDPFGYASSAAISVFRRPLPSANLQFLTTVMWDGRESTPLTGTSGFAVVDPNGPNKGQNVAALLFDLGHQANDATQTHAQFAGNLTDLQKQQIVDFELSIINAQQVDFGLGWLNQPGGYGGADNLADEPFYVGINDVLGNDPLHPGGVFSLTDGFATYFNTNAMSLYSNWDGSADPKRAQIARGEKLFNAKAFTISGVAGLNDALNQPNGFKGFCITCHDTPNVGNHSVALPINIGIADASRATLDARKNLKLPIYTLAQLDPVTHQPTGVTVQTTDPGRALITGKWTDIGKFKGPILHGLSSRAPYFHNGMAASLEEVVTFYNTRFNINLTTQEQADLAAFLKTL